jgi:hypothetical protein
MRTLVRIAIAAAVLLTASCDRDEATAGVCSAESAGAKAVARRAARLEEVTVEDRFLTTLSKIERAQEQPFEHRPSDMEAAVCLFVVSGARDGVHQTGAVVLAKDDTDGKTNLLGQFQKGSKPPAWVERVRHS